MANSEPDILCTPIHVDPFLCRATAWCYIRVLESSSGMVAGQKVQYIAPPLERGPEKQSFFSLEDATRNRTWATGQRRSITLHTEDQDVVSVYLPLYESVFSRLIYAGTGWSLGTRRLRRKS